MLTSHEHLLKHRHGGGNTFPEITVCYVPWSPGQPFVCPVRDIRALEAYYFVIAAGMDAMYIPYRRIRKIMCAGGTAWEHLSG